MAITSCPLCGGEWSTWTCRCKRCGTPQHIAVGMMSQKYYADRWREQQESQRRDDENVIEAEVISSKVED